MLRGLCPVLVKSNMRTNAAGVDLVFVTGAVPFVLCVCNTNRDRFKPWLGLFLLLWDFCLLFFVTALHPPFMLRCHKIVCSVGVCERCFFLVSFILRVFPAMRSQPGPLVILVQLLFRRRRSTLRGQYGGTKRPARVLKFIPQVSRC